MALPRARLSLRVSQAKVLHGSSMTIVRASYSTSYFRKRSKLSVRTFSSNSISSINGMQGSSEQSIIRTSPKLEDGSSSRLIINGEVIQTVLSTANFRENLVTPGLGFYDKTGFIKYIDKIPATLLLRPRRFGKSLTVSTLEHFYDWNAREDHKWLYKDLEIENDIITQKVSPGTRFILSFDFSNVGGDTAKTHETFLLSIHNSIEDFFERYADILEPPVNLKYENSIQNLQVLTRIVRNFFSKRTRPEEQRRLTGLFISIDEYDKFINDYLISKELRSEETTLDKDWMLFWGELKRFFRSIGKTKIFITGISPLAISEIGGSGFNLARNISFMPRFATICGLTRNDVLITLETLFKTQNLQDQDHFTKLKKYYNGYHFCNETCVSRVFNTQTCLDYFESLIWGGVPNLSEPLNSEVSRHFLDMSAQSPAAVHDFETLLEKQTIPSDEEQESNSAIRYSNIFSEFNLRGLLEDLKSNESAWRSLLVYYGGLTFDSGYPTELLKIPNQVARERIGRAILKRYEVAELSLEFALQRLQTEGEVEPALILYRKFMAQRDKGDDALKKSEPDHVSSFHAIILRNPILKIQEEFDVRMKRNRPGRVDMIIQTAKYVIFMEWKAARVNFLDVEDGTTLDQKAEAVGRLESLEDVKSLRYKSSDKFNPNKSLSDCITEWRDKLKKYMESDEAKAFKKAGKQVFGHLIVVVGSRHIIMHNIDGEEGRLLR